MASQSDSSAGMRHRTSSNNGSVQISLGRSSTPSGSGIISPPKLTPPPSSLHSDQRSLFNSRTLAYQKTYRARRLGAGGTRYYFLWGLSLFSLGLAWAIGRIDAHPAVLVLLVVAMVILWWDQGGRVLESIEKQTEMRVCRRKTVQHSESAEWVNLALNRWWSTCSDSMLEILKDYMEPLITEVAPPGVESVELVECDLAEQTPIISNLQLFDLPSSTGSAHSPSPYQSYVDMASRSQHTVIANLDFTLPAPDSHIVIRARLGGKKVGYNTLIYVEGLHVSGPVQAAVIIDRDAPFPHVSQITATFCRKPDIWFSVRVLKALRVMEVPVLKNWIHSFMMDMFTSLLVDPGRLTINLSSSGPTDEVTASSEPMRLACGVLTVTVHSSPPDHKHEQKNKKHGDSRRWLTLTLGKQKRKKQLPLRRDTWTVTYSFLVYDLKEDVLVTKVKLYRVVNSQVLATHSIALDSLHLLDQRGAAILAVRTRSFSNPEAKFSLDFKYTALPQVSLSIPNEINPKNSEGVLYVHIHSASGLQSADRDGLSDPYCLVLANKKKVMTTHYVLDSLYPQWEKGVEFFVTDFTQVTLTFVVYDWDGPLIGDDLLGVAKLSLSQDCPELIKKELELTIDGVNVKNSQSLGSITVSAIFRPVKAVARSELDIQRALPDVQVTDHHGNSVITTADGAESAIPLSVVGGVNEGSRSILKDSGRYIVGALSSRHVKRVAKFLKSKRQRRTSTGEGMLEVTVLRGRNLVPKDSNGLSDPYIVVKYGSSVMFRTHVIEKCLNPEWNENVSLAAPSHDDIIKVECWDKDRFSDDFMGSLQFTEQDLRQFEEGPRWYRLQHVKTGEILLVMKRVGGVDEELEWSHLDEASRPLHLVGEIPLVDNINGEVQGRIHRRGPSLSSASSEDVSIHRIPEEDNHSGSDSSNAIPQSSASGSTHSFSPTGRSGDLATPKPPPLTRRNTLGHFPDKDKRPFSLSGRSYDDTTEPAQRPRYPETKADIERALKGSSDNPSTMERSSTRSRLPTMYYNIAGQVIEASGLRGELDHLELYIKVRLNTRPTYQRQQKFGRGPVIHKTRVLRGSSNPQWREDFMVKESPVPSDSLLTVDLKSGSKINIGTNGTTLDKFFEGNLKATKSLDLGNNAKLRIRLTRQPTPQASPLTKHRVTASP